MLFKYGEPAWYAFGVMVGLRNLLAHGTALGARKTAGKILQPINSYTRFPEYRFFADAIGDFVAAQRARAPLQILDVGSPKLLGLYLAHRTGVAVHLTDVSRLNLDEYTLLWNAIRATARGRATFSQQDARCLAEEDGQLDIVYSMSVIEHIEQEMRDPRVIGEYLRVLKPGGLLVLSVPFGPHHVEQRTDSFSYETDAAQGGQPHFFQRIFDRESAGAYLLDGLEPHVTGLTVRTVYRHHSARLYHAARAHLGDNLGGLVGFTNPLWSLFYNREHTDVYDDFTAAYGATRSARDMYGDLLISCRKRA